MEIIKRKLICFLLLSSLISCRSMASKEKEESIFLAMRNFVTDSVLFNFKADEYNIVNDDFWGVNGHDSNTISKYYNKSAVLLTYHDASKVDAMITNMLNYLESIIMNDSTKRTNYTTTKINESYDKYYFCGKLLLHKGFESYVFLNNIEITRDNMFEIGDQTLWLFNVKEGLLLSISVLCNNPRRMQGWTGTFRENNVFVYFGKDEYKKTKKRFFNNQSIEKTKKRLKNIDCNLYRVNEDGYIEILR